MKKMTKYVLMMLAAFLTLGCEREQLVEGGEMSLILHLDHSQEIPAGEWTKADSEPEAANYLVEDFWLFEYNSNGMLVGKPCYYENASAGVEVTVFRPSSGEYRCYVIADTHDPYFLLNIDDYSTETALKHASRSIASSGDVVVMMSGMFKVGPSAGQSLSCTLKRNVAKLTLDLSNAEGSGLVLNTVQLKNVCDHLFYADAMYDGAPAPSPSESETGFTNLEVETVDIPAGGATLLTYYLPRNMRGTHGTAQNTADKNVSAPTTATYLEIIATDVASGTPLRYRFYLGKNMLDNFDIEPNFHYSLPITFTGGGSAVDSRVKDMGLINLEDANSYILQPVSSQAQPTYGIPVVERVNRFWDSIEGRKVGTGYGSYMIKDGTEWEAVIIWQDVPEKVLQFCDAEGQVSATGKFTATGVTPLYFKLTSEAYGNPCNVLIGVRMKNSTNYLWSWHIWITDYDPDCHSGQWNDGQYKYAVEGGYLHRYSGSYWDKSLKDKYIMDRNLGARSALRSAGLINNAGFGTQFGRKDPFPMVRNYPFYDSEGKSITFNGTDKGDPIGKKNGPAWMYQSVWNPVIFYIDTGAPNYSDWLKNEDVYTYIWSDIDGKKSGKSFFDPCPPGWKLPEKGTWDGFAVSDLVEDSWHDGATFGWDLHMGPTHDSETVFFPIAGWRGLSNGTIGYNESSADMVTTNYIFTRIWTSMPCNNKTSAYFINLGKNNRDTNFAPIVTANSTNYRAYANSVRCIQE